MPEGEVLDALRGPLRTHLGAGNPPDLLRVGAEEALVEPPPEPRRDPVLERLGGAASPQETREERERATHRLDEPELADDVPRLEWVVEVVPAVVDPREARPSEELLTEQLVPQRLDRLQLREEAMAAE